MLSRILISNNYNLARIKRIRIILIMIFNLNFLQVICRVNFITKIQINTDALIIIIEYLFIIY